MLISCPKCNSVYNISDTRIPGSGKRFKCAECGEIWRVFPQDVKSVEPESKVNGFAYSAAPKEEIDDINAMFSRLSHDTRNLFSGENKAEDMAAADKLRRFCRNSFSSSMIIAFLLVLSIVLGGFLIYRDRYEIVAHVPEMEKVYARFDIESVYNGRNIIFRDVRIRNIRRNGVDMIEISGRLLNNGNTTVNTLPVKASFTDDDGNTESEIIELLPPQRLTPKSSTLFRIVADMPSSNVSKIMLSLEDITQSKGE